jgi:hypothetical protein
VDPLVILLLGGIVATVLWSWLARHTASGGARRRRGGSGPLGLRSAEQFAEARAALEAEDLAQLLEVHNARRRRRGAAPRTVEEIEPLVAADAHDRRRRRDADLAERDLDELLEATNRRRRARGMPERTREDVDREFGTRVERRGGSDRWPAV